MTTTEEFNKKWTDHLEVGHYGMSIPDTEIIKYVDEEFEKLKIKSPSFMYSQIKMKFGTARVYLENVDREIGMEIEKGIDMIEKERRNERSHK